jgi:hypothetical protein
MVSIFFDCFVFLISEQCFKSFFLFKSFQLQRTPYSILFNDSFDSLFVGLAYQGKDIVFRFIKEYSSLRDFGP